MKPRFNNRWTVLRWYRGFCIGHVGPEVAVGGMIGLLKDGDEIIIDAVKGEINVTLSDQEIEKRKKNGSQEN